MAALFVAALVAFDDDGTQFALALALVSTLAAITITDLEHRLIPTRILYSAGAFAIVVVAVGDPGSAVERAIAAASAYGFLFAAAVVYSGGMGMGDVRLAGLLGLYLGKAVAPALLIGFAAGAVYGMALIAIRGAAARKTAVPFGPFLALGALVALFVGDQIVDWYTDTFFG